MSGESETVLRQRANDLLAVMAEDARGDEPHLPLPPTPDGWYDGFVDGYIEGCRTVPPPSPLFRATLDLSDRCNAAESILSLLVRNDLVRGLELAEAHLHKFPERAKP